MCFSWPITFILGVSLWYQVIQFHTSLGASCSYWLLLVTPTVLKYSLQSLREWNWRVFMGRYNHSIMLLWLIHCLIILQSFHFGSSDNEIDNSGVRYTALLTPCPHTRTRARARFVLLLQRKWFNIYTITFMFYECFHTFNHKKNEKIIWGLWIRNRKFVWCAPSELVRRLMILCVCWCSTRWGKQRGNLIGDDRSMVLWQGS